MQVSTLLDRVIRLEPQSSAIEFNGEWRTWGDVSRIADAINEILTSTGVPREEGVGIMLRNRPAHMAAILAGMIDERCILTINPMQPHGRVLKDIRELRPRALVADIEDWRSEDLRHLATEVGCVSIALERLETPQALPGLARMGDIPLDARFEGVAIQMLTSGTTGAPKRVPLLKATWEKALADAMVYDRDTHPDEPPRLRAGVVIVHNPFVHISGIFGVALTVLAGRRTCLLEKFSVEAWQDAVKRHKPRVSALVPTALRMMMDANIPQQDLSSLVAIRSGTAPLPQELADQVYERYGIPVLGNYGATEFAGGVAGWSYRDWKKFGREKRGSVGRVHEGIEARVVHRDTHETLPTGDVGLLELRGGQLGDGSTWVRTTDLASLDEDRFLCIHGRADNAIIRGGFKVMPGDVSKALESHADVREAAVVAIPDDRLGQVPVAVYTLEPGSADPGESTLKGWVRQRMTAYSVPVRLRCVEELPRTPSMKVSAVEVQALFSDERGTCS